MESNAPQIQVHPYPYPMVPQPRNSVVTCCGTLFQITLVLCNFTFVIGGILLIGMAVATSHMMKMGEININENTNITSLPIILMLIGAFVFSVAFYGCCGALCQSPCMLYSYGLFVGVIMIPQFVIGVMVLAYKGGVDYAVIEALTDAYNKSNGNNSTLKALTDMQNKLLAAVAAFKLAKQIKEGS